MPQYFSLDSLHLSQPGPTFIKPDQLGPWIKDQLGNALLSTTAPTVTKFCVMWEGLSLPHDTKFGNCRDDIADRRVIFIWSLIHGSSWSCLIKVGPGVSRLHQAFSPINLAKVNHCRKPVRIHSPCLRWWWFCLQRPSLPSVWNFAPLVCHRPWGLILNLYPPPPAGSSYLYLLPVV